MKRITESQAIILAAIITGTFGVIAVLVTLLSSNSRSASLPEALPSLTPKPTIVGTPIGGADIAAGGGVGFVTIANDISLVVDEVKVYSRTLEGFSTGDGYVYVVVTVRLVNNSPNLINIFDMVLVDEFDNRYRSRGLASRFNLPDFPITLKYTESGAGAIIYEVPEPAIANRLRLRLEPDTFIYAEPTTRIEIFFDPILTIE